MANVKISALPAVTTVVPGSDVLPLVSGGITTKATPNAIVQAVLPAPGAIGGTTPGSGAFTTLSASSTVSGTGFSNYLASPPAIGGTAAAAGSFTNLSYTGTFTGSTGVLNIGSGQIYKDSSGNVGIGTSSPAYKLDVNGSSTGTAVGARFLNTNATGVDKYIAIFAGGSSTGISAWNNSGVVESAVGANLVLSGYNGTILFQTGTSRTTQATLDSSGNLGLGVTPSAWSQGTAFEIRGKGYGLWNGGGNPGSTYLLNNAYFNGGFKYAESYQATHYYQYQGQHIWSTAPSGTAGNAISFTQAMTLDASGNLLVGTTSLIAGTEKVAFKFSSNTGPGLILSDSTIQNGATFAGFYASTTRIGSITANGTTGVLYNITSDQRLKENIVDAPSALSSVNAIKVRSFDWKSNGFHQDYGYIAQELLEVAPEAVSVPADPEEMMGVDFGKLTPRLVKAIQELSAELNELKQKVNA